MMSKDSATHTSTTDNFAVPVNMVRDTSIKLFRSLDPRCQRMEAIKITTNDQQGL